MILCKNLTVQTGDGATLLSGLTFELPDSSNLFVVGESGSGKTTLLEALSGQTHHEVSGWVGQPPLIADELRDGTGDRRDRPEHQAKRQDRRRTERRAASLRGALLSVQHGTAAFGPYRRLGAQFADVPALSGEGAEKLRDLLFDLGFDPSGILRRFPHECSGGMLRRLSIAAVLAAYPRVALFDEPTAGVDPSLRWQVLEVIYSRANSFVVATHDMALVGRRPDDYLLVLRNGRAVEFGPAAEVLNRPEADYTRQLVLAGRPK